MRFVIVGATVVATLASTSYAADLPVKAAPAPVIETYNWKGWYVGGNVGYGWGGPTGNDLTINDPFALLVGYAALGGLQYPSVKPQGAVGGGQIGYNWQTGNVVWGTVADFQFSGMKADQTVNVPALGFYFPQVQSHSAKTEWFGTVRGRIGYAFNNFLPYVSGGLAYGKVSSSLNVFVPWSGFVASGSSISTRVGWTFGAGFDYALAQNWMVVLDYLYTDLGHDTVTATSRNWLVTTPIGISMNQHFTANILRGTVNYKF
jgi:outer membrane immunogenic protein